MPPYRRSGAESGAVLTAGLSSYKRRSLSRSWKRLGHDPHGQKV